MKIVDRKISELIAAEYNPRQLTEKQHQDLTDSLKRFGMVDPVIVNKHPDRDNIIVGGHMRLRCWQELGNDEIPTVEVELDRDRERELNVRLNKNTGSFDWDLLANGFDVDELTDWGFDEGELQCFDVDPAEEADADADPQLDRAEELNEKWQVKTGDLWLIGEHRLVCGDSTKAEDVGRVMGGDKAALIHADPPYGMGKEKDGVQNDNLYADKLDAFQMAWWRVFRPHVADNGSAYIWGNPEGLWRLWYRGGLKDSERLTFRNEIAWDKKHGQGMESEQHRMFPTASERALFFMLGEQGFNNNADNYWEGWDSVVDYLRAEKKKTGWDIAKFKRLAGHSETSGCHWFDKSQWCFPTKEVYESWQAAAREHDAFKREHDKLKREFYATRAYFNNAHDNMTDVWEFGRVTGEERHGHATPKPVTMIQRCIKSSTPDEGLVAEPFLGSGTTMVAAQNLGRKCYGLEIAPNYCAVILERMITAFPEIDIRKGDDNA